MSRSEKIQELEDELVKTKYNKRTQHHIGLVKAKIARLKEEIEQKKKGKGKTDGYVLKKTGDATVVMVGFPSVGKSTLLNALTNAKSRVAAYEFTTLTVIPGLLEYKNAKIQIFDVPGIVGGAAAGTGRGKEVLAAIRSADLLMIVLDANRLEHEKIIKKELYDSGFRINQKKPYVVIKRKPKGGVSVGSTVPLNIETETIQAILKEFKIMNADVLIRSTIDEDQFIDVIEGNKRYIPALTIINKIDTISDDRLSKLKKDYDAVFISADRQANLEDLRKMIFDKLRFIRVYLKQPAKEPDYDEPLIMLEENTIEDVCAKLHKDFVKKFRFARVWGKSARYDGQKVVNIKHELRDKDVLELHIM